MKNPLVKSLAIASIPIGLVGAGWIISEILALLGMSTDEIGVTLVLGTIVLGISVGLFFTFYSPSDMRRYREEKERREEKSNRKLEKFQRDFEQMERECKEMEKQVNERLSRWDDF